LKSLFGAKMLPSAILLGGKVWKWRTAFTTRTRRMNTRKRLRNIYRTVEFLRFYNDNPHNKLPKKKSYMEYLSPTESRLKPIPQFAALLMPKESHSKASLRKAKTAIKASPMKTKSNSTDDHSAEVESLD